LGGTPFEDPGGAAIAKRKLPSFLFVGQASLSRDIRFGR